MRDRMSAAATAVLSGILTLAAACVPPPEAPLRPNYPAAHLREWPDRETRALRGPVRRISAADGTWEEYDRDGRLLRERTARDYREYLYDERGRLVGRHTER